MAQKSLHNRIVIPGKLARPGIQDNQMLLDARFRGHDGGETTKFFCKLLAQDTRKEKNMKNRRGRDHSKYRSAIDRLMGTLIPIFWVSLFVLPAAYAASADFEQEWAKLIAAA